MLFILKVHFLFIKLDKYVLDSILGVGIIAKIETAYFIDPIDLARVDGFKLLLGLRLPPLLRGSLLSRVLNFCANIYVIIL